MAADQAARAVELALGKVGAPYVWATAGPDTFDCSGLTWWVGCQVLGPLEYDLRSSHHQFNVWGEAVGTPRAGDLAFWDIGQGVIMGNRAGHVGMLIDGERFVHAANGQLGVRIDRLDAEWYAPKVIGYRRIFGFASEAARKITSDITGATMSFALPEMHGPIVTPNQWNGGPFPVGWDAIDPYRHTISWAAEEAGIDARIIAAVGMMETQLRQMRQGHVLEVWDDYPADGPAVGVIQVKPQVWGWLREDLNPWRAGDNIRLGAAVIAHLLEIMDGDLDAAMRKWFPARDPNGSTPDSYMRTFWGLMREMGYAS